MPAGEVKPNEIHLEMVLRLEYFGDVVYGDREYIFWVCFF